MKTTMLLGSFVALALIAACTSAGGGGGFDQQNPDDTQGPNGSSGGGGSKGGGRGGGGGGDASGLPCDVSAILQKNCQTCHGSTPSFGAPNALVTFADLTAAAPSGKKMYEEVAARVHSGAMPPSPNPKVSAADTATLDAWIAAGAQASSDSCGGGGDGDGGGGAAPLSCTPDQFIRPVDGFTMPAGQTDVYMCYGFEITAAAKRHIVAFGPRIDNKKIVHHLLLFQTDTAYGNAWQSCSIGQSPGWRLYTGWAPGGTNLEAPPEAGFPEEGTTHWILQVHYNNAGGANAGQVDKSGYDLCTTDKLRPNDADMMAFGTLEANIPPHATTDITCDFAPALLPGFHMFAGSPHMHKLGKAMSTYVNHGGQPIKVIDQPNFDFNSQVMYKASADYAPGDTFSTRCVWNNTTDGTVTWGEGTADEMCLDFVGYYPKIENAFWTWIMPSAAASCHPTQ